MLIIMSVKFPKKYYLVFTLLALVTALAVNWVTSNIAKQKEETQYLQLDRANKRAAFELQSSLNTYAALVSGIKAYIEITDGEYLEEEDIKYLLDMQLSDLSIPPPFSISYLDTNHIFQFDFTMKKTALENLEGTSLEKIIGKSGINRMDTLMRSSKYYASNPTNLIEGIVGLPLGFGILDDNGVSKGYITTVAEFAPIIDRVYKNVNKEDFVYRFQAGNGNYFDRAKSYNGQKCYAKTEDPEYFKNFNIPDESYVSTTVNFYNKKFVVSTAYKRPQENSMVMFITSLIWYLALLGFMLFLVIQFYVYERKDKMIAAQNKRLSEVVATKNKFFSIVAHDLRSPLSSVINFLDVLKQEEFKSKQTAAIIDSLEDSSRNSISLLDNLLKWSKLETGQIKYEPIPLDILAITKDQIKVYSDNLKQKGINVRLESSFKGTVEGDKNMIATVIRNLLSNAIKFSNDNDIIVIEFSKTAQDFIFTIEDNGIGMTDAYRKKILSLTETTVQKGTRNEKGSGLGLILSNEFIKTHNGELSIESQEGKGTIVTFTLPLKS